MQTLKVQATELLPNDRIIVNVAATKNLPTGQSNRIPIALVFNGLGQRLNADGTVSPFAAQLTIGKAAGAQPKFDVATFTALAAQGRRAEANAMADAFAAQQDAFDQANGGGGSLQQRIGNAVVEYICQHFGAKETDGDHLIVKREEVQVRPTYRIGENPTDFIVQLTPVWGLAA